jgi:hypothetical protein
LRSIFSDEKTLKPLYTKQPHHLTRTEAKFTAEFGSKRQSGLILREKGEYFETKEDIIKLANDTLSADYPQ